MARTTRRTEAANRPPATEDDVVPTPATGSILRASSTLRLLQFGDSMLPVGAFSFSNSLESAIQQDIVTDATTLEYFVRTATRRAALSDGIALLEAHRATMDREYDRVVVADRAVLARKLDEEVRVQTLRMGKKLIEVGVAVVGATPIEDHLAMIVADETPGTFPIAMGIVTAELGLDEREAFAIHQYGVAATLVGASLRLMRIDHMTTQKILFDVNELVEQDYRDVCMASLSDMSTFAPMTDILAAVHVQSHVRMFMS